MPTYAYRCESCGVEFERYQKFADKPLSRCPECRGRVRRVPQAAGVVFKGSGWYVTDSKSSSSTISKGVKKSSDDGAKTDGAKTESPKTESKPAGGGSDE
jgi:putative FmdB family regulatory protein